MDKIQNTVPGFLTKLWTLVEDESTDDVIRWDDLGKSFHILDGGKLAKGLLPHFFKHSNLASFIRQLNMYGFHKVLSGATERSAYSDDMQFAHAYFLRGRPDLLERIKRKVTYGRSGILESMEYSHSPMPSLQATGRYQPSVQLQSGNQAGKLHVKPGAIVPIDPSQRQPARDLPRLLQDIAGMQAKQEAMNLRLNSVKQENEVLWRELHTLRARHAKQQLIVNKVVQFLITLVGQSGSSATRFVGGLKRKMAGSSFGASGPLMLDNKPVNVHDSASTSGMGMTLRDGTHQQSSVASAAAELFQTASLLSEVEQESSAGTRQTVFVEEVDDEDDYVEYSASTSSNASQRGRPNVYYASPRSRPLQKRRRIMTANSDKASDNTYEEDDDDTCDYDATGGVQISEIGNVLPNTIGTSTGVARPTDVGVMACKGMSVSQPRIAGATSPNATLRVDPSILLSMRSPTSILTDAQQAVPTGITIDLKDLLDSVTDPQQQVHTSALALLNQPPEVMSTTSSTNVAFNVSPNATSYVQGLAPHMQPVSQTNGPIPVVLDEPTIDLPDLTDASAAKNVLSENLTNIQTQLDGLREFLANEQYAADDSALMELFNADSDVVPTGLLDLAASSSSDTSLLQRFPNELDGDEIIEYNDPTSMSIFDLFNNPSGEQHFMTGKPDFVCEMPNDVQRSFLVRSPGNKQSVYEHADEQKPFIVKTFPPASNSAATALLTTAPALVTSRPIERASKHC